MTFYAIQKLGAIAMLINPVLFTHEIAATAVIGDITHLCYGEMAEMKDDEKAFLKKLKEEGAPVTAFYSIRNHVDLTSRDEKAMKEALGKKLARFKVPSHYFMYDRFPMLGSGKIDVVTLKKDALSRA